MARLHVEWWAPEYGNPYEPDDALAAPDKVDDAVEVPGRWEPLPGADDGVPVVAFVDGVRRIDARLTLDDPVTGPVPGLCGSYAVGAVLWRRGEPRSEVVEAAVGRLAVLGGGRELPVPISAPGLAYRGESNPDPDPSALVRHFHDAMRRAEAALAEDLARGGYFVVADGPINDLSADEKVGYIKAHRAPYLSPERMPVVAMLGAGERTPLFTIGDYRRYSWYLRLAEVAGGHSWSGVVRCEVSAKLSLDAARRLADRTAALLPLVASAPHVDPRAPQNLVPIAALERDLRRRLGDGAMVQRELRAAVAAASPPAEVAV